MTFALKPLHREALGRALEKAERYRLLNEPREAESICLDILLLEPQHQEALVCLLLALTDQFGTGKGGLVHEAEELLHRLERPYDRAYYAGVIAERFAKRQLQATHPNAGFLAYQYVREAMGHFEA